MRRFRAWLGRLIHDHLVQDEPMAWTDFYGGGPKDGDREQIEVSRSEWLCVAPRAVLSPWGQEERDPMQNVYGWVVTGRYVRTGQGMKWQAE